MLARSFSFGTSLLLSIHLNKHLHMGRVQLEPPAASARACAWEDQSQPDDKVRQTLLADFAIHAFQRCLCTCCAARRLLQEGEACRSSCSFQAVAQGAHINDKLLTDAAATHHRGEAQALLRTVLANVWGVCTKTHQHGSKSRLALIRLCRLSKWEEASRGCITWAHSSVWGSFSTPVSESAFAENSRIICVHHARAKPDPVHWTCPRAYRQTPALSHNRTHQATEKTKQVLALTVPFSVL